MVNWTLWNNGGLWNNWNRMIQNNPWVTDHLWTFLGTVLIWNQLHVWPVAKCQSQHGNKQSHRYTTSLTLVTRISQTLMHVSIPTLKQTITSLHNIPYTGDKNITNIDACDQYLLKANNTRKTTCVINQGWMDGWW